MDFESPGGKKGYPYGKYVVIGAIVLAVIIVVPMIISSIVTIETGEIGVVRRLGEVRRTLSPGPNFVVPMINTVDRYDLRIREAQLDFSTYSVDAQSIRGYVSIQYRLRPYRVMEIAEQFGTIRQLESMLHSVLLREAQIVFALKTAMELVEQRGVLNVEIRQRLDGIAEEFHIVITDVMVDHMQFSADFDEAVNRRIVAEQAEIQAEIDARTAVIQATQALEVARLEAQQLVAQAESEAQALRIMRDAWDAQSIEVRNVMLRQRFFDTWDGVMPRVLTQDGMDLIMSGLDIGD